VDFLNRGLYPFICGLYPDGSFVLHAKNATRVTEHALNESH